MVTKPDSLASLKKYYKSNIRLQLKDEVFIQMDWRLFEAAVRGDIGELHQLIKEDPLILHGVALASAETPLHIACMAGHLEFVKEMMRLKPEFAGQLNQNGFSPMHMAAANGHLEIVKELLKVNNDHSRLISTNKWTAIHYAAVKGQVDIIRELGLTCAECFEDVTIGGETALHLAVKNRQFEAMRVMVETLKQVNKECVFNMMDVRGNTVLHLATSTKQQEVVELLLGKDTSSCGVVEVNAKNKSCLTALDLLFLFPSEAGHREIEEILQRRGGMRLQEVNSELVVDTETAPNNRTTNTSTTPFDSIVEYFKFQKGRDSPSSARGDLLVIVVLIATATYQAGLSPPEGMWQDTTNSSNTSGTNATTRTHVAGKAILSDTDQVSFGLFLFFNSLGFHLSIFMIQILTRGFPLRLELQVCLVAMIATYNISMASTAPNGYISILFHVFSAVFPLSIPFIARWTRLFSAKRRCVPFYNR